MKPGYQAALAICAVIRAIVAWPDTLPAKGTVDSRIRVAVYNSEEVYRLHGHAGYQIDLQFEPGETFVGLGAGDLEGLSFTAQDNHLFLKPKAASVATNLTVLTTRRHYQFDYVSLGRPTGARQPDVIYALRFTYPPLPGAPNPEVAARLEAQLDQASLARVSNNDYWYCGDAALKPVAAWDDGVHTRLRFSTRSELPAIFVRNEDGGESLLNFSIEAGDLVIHRVARQFSLRRGKLTGCIVNKGFGGSGERLASGTVAPSVERATPGVRP